MSNSACRTGLVVLAGILGLLALFAIYTGQQNGAMFLTFSGQRTTGSRFTNFTHAPESITHKPGAEQKQQQHMKTGANFPQKPGQITKKTSEVANKTGQVTEKADQVAHKPSHVKEEADRVTHKPGHVKEEADQVTHKPDHVKEEADRVTHKPDHVKEADRVKTRPEVVVEKPDLQQITPSPAKLTDQPVKLFLLTHMRGGSSIFGELFNHDPHATMWYEPGDAFFSAYYGIHAENLPQHDLYFANGTRRVLDAAESRAMTEYYSHMLSCEYDKLPPEALAHPFLSFSTAMNRYRACSRSKGRTVSYGQCKGKVAAVCGGKMAYTAIQRKCHLMIQSFQKTVQNVTGFALPAQISTFRDHQKCLSRMQEDNQKCLRIATEKCRSDELVVAQVNRMKMEDLAPLFEANPDLYVVHYVRDPRAIALSRKNSPHLLRSHTSPVIENEARFLCNRMREDLHQRYRLEERYPGRILQVKYEELCEDPVGTAQRIYHMFGGTVPRAWADYARRNMHSNETKNGQQNFGREVQNSSENAVKWKKIIPIEEQQNILTFCLDFLKEIGY